MMRTMTITASDACYESIQRGDNAKVSASRSAKKHDRMVCIFFSPSKPRRVLEPVFALSFTGKIFQVIF